MAERRNSGQITGGLASQKPSSDKNKHFWLALQYSAFFLSAMAVFSSLYGSYVFQS